MMLKKGLLFIFATFLFFSLVKNLFDYKKSVSFYEGFKSAYEKERKNNISLKTRALKNSDPYEIEKILRDKLNLSRPDEISLLLPEPTPAPKAITPTPQPIPLQWWDVFLGNVL